MNNAVITSSPVHCTAPLYTSFFSMCTKVCNGWVREHANLQLYFPKCTRLNTQQQCMKVLVPHPPLTLGSVVLISASLEGMQWYFFMVLISIGLTLMGLVIWVSSFVKCLFRSCAYIFLLGCLFLWMSSLCIDVIFCRFLLSLSDLPLLFLFNIWHLDE